MPHPHHIQSNRYMMTAHHGNLDLKFEHRNGRTELIHSKFHVPLQCFRPYYFDSYGRAYVYILTPTGGIVSGDRLDINVHLGPNCKVFLTTQAATKVYKTLGKPSQQSLHCVIEENSSFEYFPDHVILFNNADYEQYSDITLHPGATMIFADLFSAGRLTRGEKFQFSRFKNNIHIHNNTHSIILDKMLLQPTIHHPSAIGSFEEYPYAGTIYIALEDRKIEKIISSLQTPLQKDHSISGHSMIAKNYHTCRILTKHAELLKQEVEQVFAAYRQIGLDESWVPIRKC